MFLASIWLDHSQPAQAPGQTYGLLGVYLLFSLLVAALTWRNWWLDARLAAPAHLLDMLVFTAIVFSTNGYTSPFFLFFILPLLSAAIRWGWRETALTAAALVLLYMSAGLVVAGSELFELQRFIVRSGHLVILSAVLIWFGVHQQASRLFLGLEGFGDRAGREDDPLHHALNLALRASGARCGALLLNVPGGGDFAGVRVTGEVSAPVRSESRLVEEELAGAMLFRLRGNRSLCRRRDGWYRFRVAGRVLAIDELAALGAGEGFIAEVRTGTDGGWLVLWDLPALSVDYLEIGAELGRAAGAVLDRDALLSAIEEGAAARTRLSLARDVHDNVVQFLAGATFRIEAIMRAARGGRQVDPELKELKRLMIEEQGEIRSFVSALRRDRGISLAEAAAELETLAHRLGAQWDIDCSVSAANSSASIPIRLQLDLQQLLREAVANAVRHGKASKVAVTLADDGQQLTMQIEDDGSGFADPGAEPLTQPWSLKERVERARGLLSLSSAPGCTSLTMTLPLTGTAA